MQHNRIAFDFKAYYEYKGVSKRHRIFRSITNNFVMPLWISIHPKQPLAKQLKLQVLDIRCFRYDGQGYNLLYHDQKQLQEYLSYKNLGESLLNSLNKIDRESLEQIKQLYLFWNYANLVLNQMVKTNRIKKKEKIIKVRLFQITKKENGIDRKLKYLLIRQRHKLKQQTFTRQQIDIIISLQNYQTFQNQLNQIAGKYQNNKDKNQFYRNKYLEIFNSSCSGKQKCYPINISYQANPDAQQLRQTQKVKKSLLDQGFIKLLTIHFNIDDANAFFQTQITDQIRPSQLFTHFYNQFNQNRNINQIDFPFKEFVFKRQKKTFSKHYSLAFQGGGAKGLAYVGAYRALKEIYEKDEKGKQHKQIPVKSIMGSSAGGIIALAVSTGIPDYELQKVCYKMKMIPSTDRFVHTQRKDPNDPFVPRDLYGLQITIDDFKQSLKDLLDQYGLVSNEIFDKIDEIIQSNEFDVVQQKFIKFLQAKMPTIGQILRYQPKQPTKLTLLNYLIYGNKQTKTKKIKINWEGLLLHGALMKGQAIHDIAAECLLKFFLKQDLLLNKQLDKKLHDALYTWHQHIVEQNKRMAEEIIDCIKKHKEHSQNLLVIPLEDIYEYSPQHFRDVIITIVNRFLVLINRYCDQQGDQKDKEKGFLLHRNIKIHQLYELFGSNSPAETFFDYSTKINTTQKAQQCGFKQKLIEDPNIFQTYNSLNSVLNRINLIKPDHFLNANYITKQFIKDKKFNIGNLLQQIFPQHYKLINLTAVLQRLQPNEKNVKKYFIALQGAQTISEVIDFFYDKTIKSSEKQLKKPKVIVDYQGNYNKFLQQMKKITLRQYYALTGIEMTCTSVDLDDRILRFFNHKSTPNLPVCKCVQMSGSFPFGFKAQRWKQEWGYYNIYLSRKRIQIDLTQHQFTDGGLLANFPIKYLDNFDIRRKYFAHEFVQNKTLLYGFGLDYLNESKYVPSEPQLQQIIKQRDQAEIAWQDLTSYLGSWAMKLKLFKFATPLFLGESKETVEWSKIYHKIIERIPLLRFIVKIAFAYPNADRNLNLQVFENRVAVHELEKPFSIKQFEDEQQQQNQQNLSAKQQNNLFQCEKSQTRSQCLDRGRIIQFQRFYRRYIKRAEQYIKMNDVDRNYYKKNKLQRQQQAKKIADSNSLNYAIERRAAENKLKYKKIGQQLENVVQKDPLSIFDAKENRKDFQKNITLLLIEVLLYNLRHSKNVQAVKHFNQQYAYYKFLIQESDSKGLENYRIDLNKKNFRKLYKHDQFQQISRHLSFQQFKEKHYKELVKKEQQFIELQRQGMQSFGITRFLSTYPERQRFLRNQAYSKRTQINQIFKTQEFQQKLREAQNANDDFSCMRLYDVTDGMKRLTQFLFLVIKNKEIQKENISPEEKKKKSKHIIELVKQNNFEQLLISHQENAEVIKLTQFELIQFIRDNLNNQTKQNRINLQPQFSRYIQSYARKGKNNPGLQQQLMRRNSNQNPGSLEQKLEQIVRLYIIRSLRIDQKVGQNQQSQQNRINKQERRQLNLQKHQLKDLFMYKLKPLLLSLGKYEILDNYKHYYRVLRQNEKLIPKMDYRHQRHFFQLIYSDNPTSDYIMKQSQEEWKKRNGSGSQLSTPNIYPISNEESERLQQQKSKIQNALFNVLIKVRKNRRPQELNCKQYFKQKQQFYQNIRLMKKQLISDTNPLYENVKRNKQQNKAGIAQVKQNFLKMLKVDAIQFLVRDKIHKQKKLKSLPQCQSQLQKMHRVLCSDIQTLFMFIRQTILLLQHLVEQNDRRPSEKIVKCLQNLGIQPDNNWIFITSKDIQQQFIRNYAKLSNLSLNQIDQLKLGDAFIITFKHINKLAKVYVQFRNVVAEIKQQQRQNKQQHPIEHINSQRQQQVKLVYLVYHSIRRINNTKFSLPMFTSDWNLSVKSTEQAFKDQISSILTHQNNPKFTKAVQNDRYQTFKSQYEQIEKNYFMKSQNAQRSQDEESDKRKRVQFERGMQLLIAQLQNKNLSQTYQSIKKVSEKDTQMRLQYVREKRRRLELVQKLVEASKQNPFAEDNFNVHLVLQGVNHSNQCIGAYYFIVKQIIERIAKEKQQQDKPKSIESKYKQYIKAITCSNFHSIFGFLLVLGKDPETIRKEMYHLKHLAATMEHQKNINQYFDQQQFFNNTPNKYAQVLKYLEQQTEGIFEQLQKKSKLNFADNSLKKQFSEMRLIFEHQKQNLMSMYQKIFDQTCEQIKFIDDKYMQEEKGNEIAKKYAFDYNCGNKNKKSNRHFYKELSQQSIKKFNEIIGMVFKSFGDLLTGIIANALSNNSLFLLNQSNAQLFVKGVVAQRLFTTYKLKEYIICQLKEEKLSPNITLAEFYSVKRTIFLNFTVININEQRLDFLNKETMPNMPVWAAIIASSSMPFFHKFFEGSKEWEAPSSENFYGYIIEDFFKTYQSKERITNYLSGNYISSMPLQLLTNSAVTKKMFADEKIRYLKFFGLAFNQTYKNPIAEMKITKRYLNFEWKSIFRGFGYYFGGKIKEFKNNNIPSRVLSYFRNCKTQSHQNNAYKIQYPIGQYISSYLDSGSLVKTKETLFESNDNFILKWYYNKLIRLPIKINTLEFLQIVDENIRKTYNINLPSAKAQQTIERSYEITKSFIDQLKPTEDDKYKAIFRAQIMSIHHEITGFDRQHIKVSFLNHSKWNQNRYNNFVVEYATVVHGIQPRFKRAAESQILWLVEESSKLKVRFYYPHIDDQNIKASKIMFTEFILDFSELIKRPSSFNKDSFDYELIFAGDHQSQFQINREPKLKATKMNKININWDEPGLKRQIDKSSDLLAKLLCLPQISCELVKQKDAVFDNYYIQRSKFPLLPKEDEKKGDSKA